MRILLCLTVFFALIGSSQAQRFINPAPPPIELLPGAGWRLTAAARIEVQFHADVLMIQGKLFNTSPSERPSPRLRVVVQDNAGREIYHWTVPADKDRIKPGDYAPFTVRLESAPQDMDRVVIKTP
jgi:hypothetical protein